MNCKTFCGKTFQTNVIYNKIEFCITLCPGVFLFYKFTITDEIIQIYKKHKVMLYLDRWIGKYLFLQ